MAKDQPPATIYLADYQPPDFAVEAVALDFDLDEPVTRVRTKIDFRRERGPKDGPMVLLGDGPKLISIAMDGRTLDHQEYAADATSLTIHTVPQVFSLDFEVDIRPGENTQLSGLYTSKGAFCTQCEAEGFRRITYFPDRPDVMTVFTVTVRADKATCPVLLSNGNLIDQKDLPGERHVAVWSDPFPKPSYLFALVAGDLACVEDSFTTMSGRDVRLRIFVEHGNEDRCGYAMDVLKRAMKWDEDRFGREYDLDLFNIVAVSDFNMGAMENKSLNIFNAKYVLADPELATDSDYAGIETVVAHEYFHNWTGNRVTCRDWFQLSLKEGLTVFRDQEFSADMRSATVKRIGDVHGLRAAQFPEDAGPLAHPIRPAAYIQINNFYTSTVYQKGAEVIRMMHTLLGRDGFRAGMDLYFERHDGQAVTCEDFVAAMEDANAANGADLGQFKLWYSQAGTPELKITTSYDDGAKTYDLTVAQTIPKILDDADKAAPEPMHIPLAVGLLDAAGGDLPLVFEGEDGTDAPTTRVLQITQARQTFRFVGVDAEPLPSLNRGFSAPVIWDAGYSDGDRARLMAGDTDPFARWEAGQQYGAKVLLGMIAEIQKNGDPVPDPAIISAIGAILGDRYLDRATIAHSIVLPGEGYLAEQMKVVDVVAIHTARDTLRRAIAKTLRDDLLQTYHANQSNERYSPDALSAGRRALKNTALAYLATLEDPAMLDLVRDQYQTADNMTDIVGALAVLNNLDVPARTEALDDFFERFHRDALVVEKWLSLQAMTQLPGALDTVKNLMEHEAFSIRNPNKVRALIGGFAMGNPLAFHAADGSGYTFLADRVIELDALNPSLAARLLPPLGRWRRFDPARQKTMKAELNRILGTDGLSTDTYELATKSLG